MDNPTREVVRQAVMEYLSRRGCYIDQEDEDNARGLRDYVAERYKRLDERFRERKLESLLPRVLAAIAFLKEEDQP